MDRIVSSLKGELHDQWKAEVLFCALTGDIPDCRSYWVFLHRPGFAAVSGKGHFGIRNPADRQNRDNERTTGLAEVRVNGSGKRLELAITTPVVNYFEHSTYLTVNHGHTALFSTYGMLAIGLLLFSMRGIVTERL